MTPTISTESLTRDGRFAALRDHIVSATGLCFYAHRPESLATHIVDRLTKHGLDDCEGYLRLLQDQREGEEELDQLIELLTIGETYFFRHQEAFEALREVVLPEIIRRNQPTKRLRVWSAGCSIGAEAYSVSILLNRELAPWIRDWNVSILGTDINRRFLAQATAARFENWAFRGTPELLRQNCFARQGKVWRIHPEYREGVSFQYHNLARHPIPSLVHNLSAFDVILCRNVLIYFGQEAVERLVTRMHECLVPGGWLIVGHAEYNAKLFQGFETVNCRGAVLYRKPVGDSTTATVIPVKWSPPQWIEPMLVDDIKISSSPQAAKLQESAVPDESSIELASIRAFADAGNIEAGLVRCRELVASNPLHPTFHFYHALLLDQIGDHDGAVAALRRAIYFDREFILAHYYLGLTEQRQAHAKEATGAFENVLNLLAAHCGTIILPDADGLVVADLEELTRMHLDTLRKP